MQLKDISIYQITKDHLVVVSETKNDHTETYLVIMKVKKKGLRIHVSKITIQLYDKV